MINGTNKKKRIKAATMEANRDIEIPVWEIYINLYIKLFIYLFVCVCV